MGRPWYSCGVARVTSSEGASHRFLPVLVVSEDVEWSSRVAAALHRALNTRVETASLADWDKKLRAPGSVGALVYATVANEATLQEQLGVVVDACRLADPGLPVVLAAQDVSPRGVAAALRRGAAEALFLGPGEKLEGADGVAAMVRRRGARVEGVLFDEKSGAPRLLGASAPMREVARLVERVAQSDATVLLLGESGTGKELVAQALHVFSPRRRGPFVAINCAAIPETLLENELFGHEKGSYTGASSTAMGKVEAAERGTLFLDEIGEMPVSLQAKILRLLQERTYDRIGGTKTRKADVRIIAATNKDLKEEVARRRFREDLYYRLSVVPIALPALRQRPDDIPLLARATLERLARELGRPGLTFSPEALQRLVSYRWPGNVRELENELERAVVLSGGDEIRAQDLELRSRVDDPDRAALARLAPLEGPLERTVSAAAQSAAQIRIALALEETGGDMAQAAERLGISVDTLEKQRR